MTEPKLPTVTLADEVAAALREVEEACPCRMGYSGLCVGNMIGCRCRPDARPNTLGWLPCGWPGHALARKYGDLCRKLGREEKR